MTLINYMSRVHFADGVLEVALSSELELKRLKRPLLVSEKKAVSAEFVERVTLGMPFGCDSASYQFEQTDSSARVMSAIQRSVRECDADVIVAFGSSAALSVVDVCCRTMGQLAGLDAGSTAVVPVMFAIPGVDGMPVMSLPSLTGYRQSRTYYGDGIQPAAVFCDPTLIVGESVTHTASALANTFARCLSARLSMAYNPPADGIAMDGLKRIVQNLPAIASNDSLDMRRELMAASLNGTLALQKRSGVSSDLSAHFKRTSEQLLDEGALMRLLILVECDLVEQMLSNSRVSEVRQAMNIASDTSLREWAAELLGCLPLPESLCQMGIDASQIARVSEEVAATRPAEVPDAVRLEILLNAADFPCDAKLLGNAMDDRCVTH